MTQHCDRALTVAYLEAVPPEISISDAAVAEGDSGTTTTQFQVTLSAPSNSSITVDDATADEPDRMPSEDR